MRHNKKRDNIVIYTLPRSSPDIPSSKCGGPVLNGHTAGCHMGPSTSGCSEWGHTGLQGINNVLFPLRVAANQPTLHHAILIFIFSLKSILILHAEPL